MCVTCRRRSQAGAQLVFATFSDHLDRLMKALLMQSALRGLTGKTFHCCCGKFTVGNFCDNQLKSLEAHVVGVHTHQ